MPQKQLPEEEQTQEIVARVDHHRAIRHGFPEVILGQGKTAEQIAAISERILARHANLLVSRTTEDVFHRIAARLEHLLEPAGNVGTAASQPATRREAV